MKLTFKILTRHIAIGALITFIVFWVTGELAGLLRNITWIMVLIPLISLLVIWWFTDTIFRYVSNRVMNRYVLSAIFILFIWLTLFISITLLEGITALVRIGKNVILDAFEGYIVYQLWVYLGLGIFHALIGGIFLAIDLRKIVKKKHRVY